MLEASENPSGTNLDMIKVVLNTLYLCLGHSFEHIAKVEGPETASQFKASLLEAVESGSIDMALLEDAATYDFVVSMIKKLPTDITPPD